MEDVNPREWSEQEPAAVWPGQHQPLGGTWSEEATNFAVYAPEATRVEVCLFDDDAEGGEVERRFELGLNASVGCRAVFLATPPAFARALPAQVSG